MKEEKLFDIVKDVDDDLICEMLEYNPDTKAKGEEYVGALYPVSEKARKIIYWKYPVTAAALILVLVGVLIVFNSGNTLLPYNNNDVQTSSEQTTANSEPTTTSYEENNPSDPGCTYSPYAVPADTKINYEFTEEDEELHDILKELDNGWSVFARIDNDPTNYTEDGKGIWVNFTQVEASFELFYFELSEELPFGNIEELKAEINRCFTEDAADQYISDFHLAKAQTVSENEGIYILEITDYEFMPINDDGEPVYITPTIFELDGKLYRLGDVYGTRLMGIDYSTTRVLSRTDDELVFAFIFHVPYEEYIVTAKETLKFVDGGWKYDRFLTYPEPENELDFYEVWGTANTQTSEKSDLVVPDKVVNIGTINVMYTSSYPEFSPAYTTGIVSFKEMSTSELMKYYGLDNILYEMEQGNLTEVTEEDTLHGIYIYQDRSIYDINTFNFMTSYDDLVCGKKFTVTVGRVSTFGHEYSDEPDPVWGTTPKYYNEEMETFFVIHEMYGSCVMISGKVGELSDFNDEQQRESYHNYYSNVGEDFWQGVPYELELFLHDVVMCLLNLQSEGIIPIWN